MLSLLKHLLESTDIAMSDEVKDAKPYLNRISHMLFGKKCEPVVDEKRGKEPKFFGVANTKSKIVDSKGKSIRLTFDNSTDSGEFEINSLTPLSIISGGDLDKKIKALYKKYKIQSKKKVNYLDQGGDLVMREIHLGRSPDEHAVKFVRDFLKLIKGETVEDETEEVEEKPKEKVKEESEEPFSVFVPSAVYLTEGLPLLKTLIDQNLRPDECFIVKAYISDDKTLEIDDSNGGPKVYAQGSLKQCQNWILKNPRYISTIMGADRRLKSHKVPKSYGLAESLDDQEWQILDEATTAPKVVQVKTKIYLCDIGGGETQWLTKSQGEVLYTAYAKNILVKTNETRNAAFYVSILNDGTIEKERLSFTNDEITKLGSAVKVVLKDS